MRTAHRIAAAACCGLLVTACGSDGRSTDDDGAGNLAPADVAGEYFISVTNGDNGCGFGNWAEGNTSLGFPLYITQAGRDIEATVGGLNGGFIDLWLGERTFQGDVDGHQVSVTLTGTKAQKLGDCSYIVDVLGEASLEGDDLEGSLAYAAQTEHGPECAALTGCVSRQDFRGSRHPD